MSAYTPTWFEIRERLEHDTWLTADEADRWLAEHDAKVRAEAVEYVAQVATDTLRMCQAGGVGEKNILPLQQEVGFQLCIDNIENLAKSMKEELK